LSGLLPPNSKDKRDYANTQERRKKPVFISFSMGNHNRSSLWH
jgi:hypothetical protein